MCVEEEGARCVERSGVAEKLSLSGFEPVTLGTTVVLVQSCFEGNYETG